MVAGSYCGMETNMKITNLEEANQFVGRTYRQGWNV